ncbi:MAG: hypothetical protein QOK16_2754 [Solirubrobacteraceae bacterium]|jgi:hypothetical protein|nr:hypothetical protein [Solirubrobacteraceae bacterium]
MSDIDALHTAEHRALRELYVMARKLRDHWRALGGRIQTSAPHQAALLRDGSDVARGLIGELIDITPARGLHGQPAAEGLGARLASMHSALLDTALEVNQALRFAALEVAHVVTLLDYVAQLAARRGDQELEAFLTGWAERMREHEAAIRAAAVSLAKDPDTAVEAAAPGIAGRAGHGLATAAGTIGEWIDGRAAR